MKKFLYIYIITCLAVLLSTGFIYAQIMPDQDNDGLTDFAETITYHTNPLSADTDLDSFPDATEIFFGYSPNKPNGSKLENLKLSIPYIHESPDGSWTGPWKNGCEEASILMVEKFYMGQNYTNIKESMDFMMSLFEIQNSIWGSNADADAYRTSKLINEHTKYNATVITYPTIEDIKKELQQRRPVISLHYGKTLNNPNIPFLTTGSYYHMNVIIGYDEPNQEFIVHDTGDTKTGNTHHYKYSVFMESLSDFDFSTHKTNGKPTVIFTYPKLAKSSNNPKVYFLQNKTKQWITDEQTFNANGWDWEAINIVQPYWLNTLTDGPIITE